MSKRMRMFTPIYISRPFIHHGDLLSRRYLLHEMHRILHGNSYTFYWILLEIISMRKLEMSRISTASSRNLEHFPRKSLIMPEKESSISKESQICWKNRRSIYWIPIAVVLKEIETFQCNTKLGTSNWKVNSKYFVTFYELREKPFNDIIVCKCCQIISRVAKIHQRIIQQSIFENPEESWRIMEKFAA